MRVLLDGLGLVESPRWIDGRLWFSDWTAGRIVAAGEDGDAEVLFELPSFPFCFDVSPAGGVLVVSGREGLLLRGDPGGSLVTRADLRTVAPPPWNDIVVDARGNAYVNCTGFDFPAADFAPGCIARIGADGAVREVAGDLAFPNGMAITADGSTLIVAESYGGVLTAFDIGPDGGLSGRRVWAELPGGAPDGICLDADGAAWYGDVPNRCCVRVAEGGEVLQRIELDRGCFACMLGGAGGRTLFMTAADWGGPSSLGEQAASGRVLMADAPAPHAGRP